MGALHTVFAFLHAIGKFINASGLDLCFQKADIYGEATIEQIKGGKANETWRRSININVFSFAEKILRLSTAGKCRL